MNYSRRSFLALLASGAAAPLAADYESCAIYVPGAYMKAQKNADGTFTCTPDFSASVAGFTAKTAPIVMPINTGGYAAQAAATSYNATGLSTYMQAGFVYVFSGCRGKTNGTDSSGALQYPGGAPWGVTDLKACVRFLRGNAALLPGNTDRIFTFGHSGGGAQSSLMGTTGDSELYKPYLNQIGAVMTDASGANISDAVYGSMCWCPVTSLDWANEAYEWNMGQFASTGTRADGTFTQALSKDLANAYAGHINQLGLKDSKGTALTLDSSEPGIFASGSYYDHLVGVVETSLNNFLADTTFPYTPSSSMMADGGFPGSGSSGMGGGTMPSGATGGMPSGAAGGSAPSGASGTMPSSGMPSGAGARGAMMMGGSTTAVGTDSSATYNTVQDYIDALNVNTAWVTYDTATKTAKITGLKDFSQQCKQPSKDVCAFDGLAKSQAENSLFCTPDQATSHFDPTIAGLLQQNQSTYAAFSDWNNSYPADYQTTCRKPIASTTPWPTA